MLAPAISDNEPARIDALHKLGLLDTQNEERFSRYTRIAKTLIDVPIATISLIDASRQWFKGACGLDLAETPRRVSFCGHAIHEQGVFYIPDALEDPRFADNPLVTGDPHIRFYAGCPIYVPGNLAIGTLCVIDRRPRRLDAEQLLRLRDLADCLQRELSLHVLLRDIERFKGGPALAALLQDS
jgi:GAF domain-containing protein